MKKIIILICLFSIINFTYEITNLKYVKEISSKSKNDFKEYTIKNNEDYIIRYDFFIEGNDKVEITPKNLILLPNEEKTITAYITPENKIGKKNYYLIIKEKIINKEEKNNELRINLTSRILQEYNIK